MQETTIDIWKRKVDWIASHGGMILVNTHPDYICFDGIPQREEFRVELYIELLEYIHSKYDGCYWNALPRNVAEYWRMVAESHSYHRNCRKAQQNDYVQGSPSGASHPTNLLIFKTHSPCSF